MAATATVESPKYTELANKFLGAGLPSSKALQTHVVELIESKSDAYIDWLLALDSDHFSECCSSWVAEGVFPGSKSASSASKAPQTPRPPNTPRASKSQPAGNVQRFPSSGESRRGNGGSVANQDIDKDHQVKVHGGKAAANFTSFKNRNGQTRMYIEMSKVGDKDPNGNNTYQWFDKHVISLNEHELVQFVAVMAGIIPRMWNFETKSAIYHAPKGMTTNTTIEMERQDGNFFLKLYGKHAKMKLDMVNGKRHGSETGELVNAMYMIPISFNSASGLMALAVWTLQQSPLYFGMSLTDIMNMARGVYGHVKFPEYKKYQPNNGSNR